MARFVSTDEFTAANGTTLQSYSASWTKHTSSANDLKIFSNAVSTATGETGFYYHSATPGSANYRVVADIIAGGFTPNYEHNPFICGRMSTSAVTFYGARHYQESTSSVDAWQLYKVVAGTFTQLGSNSNQTLTTGNSYQIELRMVDSAISMRKEGGTTDLISATDSAITDSGKAGIRFRSTYPFTTRAYLDNFYAEDFFGSVFARASSRQRHLVIR